VLATILCRKPPPANDPFTALAHFVAPGSTRGPAAFVPKARHRQARGRGQTHPLVIASRRRRRGNPWSAPAARHRRRRPAARSRLGLLRRLRSSQGRKRDPGSSPGRRRVVVGREDPLVASIFVAPGSTRGPAAFVPKGSTPAGTPPRTIPPLVVASRRRRGGNPWTAPAARHRRRRPAARSRLGLLRRLRSSQGRKRDPGSSPGRRGGRQFRTGLPMSRGCRSTGDGRLLLFCAKSCLSANDPIADLPANIIPTR
jgi:hypothetical protein